VHMMRQQLSIPIVGMEPGIKPAVIQSRNKRVGILATAATVASDKFTRLAESYGKDVELSIQACPGLVEQIEAMAMDSFETRKLLSNYLAPLQEREIDTLALGCTHYPFLLPQIREILGDAITIIDTGPPVAEQLKRVLGELSALREKSSGGGIKFYATDVSDTLTKQMSELWGEEIELNSLSSS